jgi:uncharacterized membrane protein YagU involved in acid resistance
MERSAHTVTDAPHVDASLAVIGVVSGILAAMAMDGFSRTMRAFNHGREADGAAPGGPRDGKGAQPAQAIGSADQDATVKVGTAAFRTVAGYTPSREAQQWLGTAAHYAFSAAVGLNYVIASEKAPDLRRGFGTVYGSLVWATADEGAMPALGLSKPPDQVPLGVHAYALGAHWVYGLALEACRRVGLGLVDAWRQSRNTIEAAPEPPTETAGAASGAF